MELSIEINKNIQLDRKNKNAFIEAYRVYFVKMYGHDIVDLFLTVSDLKTNEATKRNLFKGYSKNYKKALDVFNDFEINSNYNFINIYNNELLIGIGRLEKISDIEVKILEVVFLELNNINIYDLWKDVISLIEKYLREKEYKKIYLEIPFQAGPLLIRASELGFIEDPIDIIVDKDIKTYLLNKNIERDTNE